MSEIEEIKQLQQINPLFSTCKVRVLYTGLNRNMSIITKEAVEKALPTLKYIPIVGEFSLEAKDFKGHGGTIDLDSYKYIHTTKPYGVVPETATVSWEEVEGRDGITREYLTIEGCYLWTGRYEEAFSVIERGKGQSMEIEVNDGVWDEEQNAYRIDDFVFSSLCILGDDTEPAFEDANITAYSLNRESFEQELSVMLKELKFSLNNIKEEDKMTLEQLLEKYSVTTEELDANEIAYADVSLEDLEVSLEAYAKAKKKKDEEDEKAKAKGDEGDEDKKEDPKAKEEPKAKEDDEEDDEDKKKKKGKKFTQEDFEALQSELETLKKENKILKAFKQGVEEQAKADEEAKAKAKHEADAQAIFTENGLDEEDVKDLDVHAFTLEELEEKAFAILGRKFAKQGFSKQEPKAKEDEGIKVKVQTKKTEDDTSSESRYGDIFEK